MELEEKWKSIVLAIKDERLHAIEIKIKTNDSSLKGWTLYRTREEK